jgi:hypothetical protein
LNPKCLVYVAGRYSAPSRAGVERNIRAAVAVGITVAELGAMPVVPHANTADAAFEETQPYQFWIEGTLELLRRCDAVLMVEGWQDSRGARGEHAEAKRLGKPIFETAHGLKQWLNAKRDTIPCTYEPEEETAE